MPPPKIKRSARPRKAPQTKRKISVSRAKPRKKPLSNTVPSNNQDASTVHKSEPLLNHKAVSVFKKFRYRIRNSIKVFSEKWIKPRKGNDLKVEDQFSIPDIPESALGLLNLRLAEILFEWKAYGKSRIELWRQARKTNGPGTLEIMTREFVFVPMSKAVFAVLDYSRSYLQVNEVFAKQKTTSWSEIKGNTSIPTWHEVEFNQHKIQAFAAAISLISIILAISIHELQFRGYVPLWSEDCANPTADAYSCFVNPCTYVTAPDGIIATSQCPSLFPNQGVVNILKIINSVLTVLLILTVFIYYRYQANIMSLRNHVEFNQKLTKHDLQSCGLLSIFIFEILVCVVHQIPYYNVDLILDTRTFSSRVAIHTLDGVLSIIMMLRLYHLWRWYEGNLFAIYTSRNFIARLNHQTAGTLLALKLLILASPMAAAFQFALVVILIGSYLFRVAEASTNISVARYYWESLYFTADTFFGGGAYDPAQAPQSAFGRMIAIIVRFHGIFWFSILVASCRQYLRYNFSELLTIRWLQMGRLITIHQENAARCIQRLWRYGSKDWRVARSVKRFRISKIDCRKFEEQNNILEATDFEVFLKIAAFRQSRIAQQVENKYRSMRLNSDAGKHKNGVHDKAPLPVGTKWKSKKDSSRVNFNDANDAGHAESNSKPKVAIYGHQFGLQPCESFDNFRDHDNTSVSWNFVSSEFRANSVREGSHLRNPEHMDFESCIFGDCGILMDTSNVQTSSLPGSTLCGSHFGYAHGSDLEELGYSNTIGTAANNNKNHLAVYSNSAAKSMGMQRVASQSSVAASAGAKKPRTEINSKELAKYINYDLVLDKDEKAVLDIQKQRMRGKELLNTLHRVLERNDALLRAMGYEPLKYEPPNRDLKEERAPEQWEQDWSARLDRVEMKIASIDEALTGSFGQIFLLIEGLYAKRKRNG